MKVSDHLKNIIDQQEAKGLTKYGQTVDDAKLTDAEWIRHAQEEIVDLLVYLEKLKRTLGE
jgi:hypothetical protein